MLKNTWRFELESVESDSYAIGNIGGSDRTWGGEKVILNLQAVFLFC